MDGSTLIVGLGNPGAKYSRTRHNAGFLVVDELATRLKLAWADEARFAARLARANVGDTRVLLAKPQTFMNASGEAVAAVMRFYQIPVSQLLVVVDDADLPLGTLRMRSEGSAGGHHGLESILAHLSDDRGFARQRVGIGRTDARSREIAGHVLGQFTAAEWAVMQETVVRAADQIECWLRTGVQQAMNKYNGAADRSADDKDRL